MTTFSLVPRLMGTRLMTTLHALNFNYNSDLMNIQVITLCFTKIQYYNHFQTETLNNSIISALGYIITVYCMYIAYTQSK